jgi:hypothetical protein
VHDPVQLFREVARVLLPRGRYVVCSAQRPAPDDVVALIMSEMSARVDERRAALRPRGVTTGETIDWAATAGFGGFVHEFQRSWYSSPAQELEAIRLRQWPAMRELSDPDLEEVTRPAIEALEAMPASSVLRRATAELVVFMLS